MNAEFLEKYIVISSKTVEGTTTYSTPKVRKNLAPISFIGAVVVTDDDAEAYAVESATSTGEYTIAITAGPFTVTYYKTTGQFAVAKS